ncbi:MAG: hypothetical protein HY961_15910 [Ignavibacteriae bacterium]|nr:hypothetical protein [Ignavibacteriota bacterium]
MIRLFLAVETFGFMLAALVHFGVILQGNEHERARIPESIIALVLLIGLVLISFRPALTRRISFAVQGFALLGTLVGVFTIIVGIGPQSAGDIVFHVCIVALLVTGLILTKRTTA